MVEKYQHVGQKLEKMILKIYKSKTIFAIMCGLRKNTVLELCRNERPITKNLAQKMAPRLKVAPEVLRCLEEGNNETT